MTDKTPDAEATEQPPEEQETQPEVLETLRSDVAEMKTNLKEEVVNAFRDELQKLSQPQRERVPAPEIERDDNRATPGIRVTGHASDPLYRSLSASEQAWRNRHSDGLAAQYLAALANSRHDLAERYAKELNDLCRADELAEGLAGSNAGIGTGTGAPLIPIPLANTISEQRNRVAKIRRRAQVFTSPNQTLRIPTNARAVAQMVAEGATASNFPSGLGTVVLSKKKMQARFAITREMLADSPFNLISFFTGRAGQALGELEDQVFLNVRPGDGNAAITRPVEDIRGEVQVTPTLPGRLGYSDIVNLGFGLKEQYTNNSTFFGNQNAMKLLSNIKDADGRPIFSPIVSAPETLGDQLPGQRGTIFGRPVIQLPLTTSGGDSNLVDLWLGRLAGVRHPRRRGLRSPLQRTRGVQLRHARLARDSAPRCPSAQLG
jgi:HK97 family phage major capsid protein